MGRFLRGRSDSPEPAVERSKELAALVAASSEFVFRLSGDGCRLLELDGRKLTEDRDGCSSRIDAYLAPEDRSAAIEAFGRAARSGSHLDVEHRYRRPDGTRGWVRSRAVPLVDEHGRIIEWVGAATDVTAQKHAQEALREAEQRKDEFLAILAHELRNPLAPLRAGVAMLEQADSHPELIGSLRPMMDRQLSHLGRLVDDLREVSRIRCGRLSLARVPLDLNTPVQAAIEQATPLIESRNQRLQVRLATDPLAVDGDCHRLTQVFANLLHNAAKYTDEGGAIGVTSAEENGQAMVSVEDTGQGIRPEQFEHLFDFFRGVRNDSSAEPDQGLGIGLALSHQLISVHRGAIDVESEGSGRGSRFIVRLPMRQSARSQGISAGN